MLPFPFAKNKLNTQALSHNAKEAILVTTDTRRVPSPTLVSVPCNSSFELSPNVKCSSAAIIPECEVLS